MLDAPTTPLSGLYAITPGDVSPSALLAGVAAAVGGGARIVQYRDKGADAARRGDLARALLALCRQMGARLLINDDLDLAREIDADGVHLGASDGDLRAARDALGRRRLLGASCYASFEQARVAAAAGVDYLAFGAVYPSTTKPHAVHAPLSLFSRCRRELQVPACAIGGVTVDNAPILLAAGADLLAVISDLFSATDIAARAAAYQSLFKETRRDSSQPGVV